MVNNLTGTAFTQGNVRLQSDGSPWRPLVHVEDISRAFLALLEAPRDVIHNEAFNVGRDEDVVQIRTIAEQVSQITGAPVSFAEMPAPTPATTRSTSRRSVQRCQPSNLSGWSLWDRGDLEGCAQPWADHRRLRGPSVRPLQWIQQLASQGRLNLTDLRMRPTS